MIYPDADPKEWAERWKLPLDFVFNCPKCGGEFPLNVPIYLSETAGFESTKHGCGPDFTKVVLTPRTEKAKAFWREVLS